jgi:hypothetical protein
MKKRLKPLRGDGATQSNDYSFRAARYRICADLMALK